MPSLVAAFDKFRGTVTAAEAAAAAARAARSCGWRADELPLADGGEGTLDALWALWRVAGAERRHTLVRGPLGEPVQATWLFLPEGLPLVSGVLSDLLRADLPSGVSGRGWRPRPGSFAEVRGPLAVVEAALAVGRGLLPAPQGDDPLMARTDGVGDLVLAALDAGARLVIVAAGGTATTDGGWGALSAIGSSARLGGAALVVACDVSVPFRTAAERFGPQKGATRAQVVALSARLDALAERYRRELGVDVDRLAGAGAAGGLAGGLAALGAQLVPGFALIASLVDLDARVAASDLVVTGEGRLDETSFQGKVVGGVLAAAGGGVPALCVAGQMEPGVERCWADRKARVDAVSLVARFGKARAHEATADAISEVVAATCAQ